MLCPLEWRWYCLIGGTGFRTPLRVGGLDCNGYAMVSSLRLRESTIVIRGPH
jgi:hypothetical protein